MSQEELALCRGQLRTALLRDVIYQPIQRALFGPPMAGEHYCGVNLMLDDVFREGATHWRDLTEPGARLVSHLLNAMAHAGHQKAASAKYLSNIAGRRPGRAVRFQVIPHLQTMLSTEMPADETRGIKARSRRVVGYRLAFGTRPYIGGGGGGNNNINNNNGADGGGGHDDATAADDGGGGGGDAPQQREALLSAMRQAPLTAGLLASFQETAAIQNVVHKSNSSKVPASILAYRYAGTHNPDAFHFGVAVDFLVHGQQDQRVDHEPRAFLTLQDGEVRTPSPAQWLNPEHATHPDHVFSKESLMYYRLGNRALFLDPVQLHLDAYIPGAAPTNDDDAMDVGDIDIRLSQWLKPAAPGSTTAFVGVHADVAVPPQWPFPHVVFALNTNATLAEVLVPYMPLPFAVGAVLPPEVWESGERPPIARLVPLLQSTVDLQRLEQQTPALVAPLTAPRGTNLDSWSRTIAFETPEAMGVSNLSSRLAERDGQLRDMASLETNPTTQEVIRAEQQRVVARAVSQLNQYYQACRYSEFGTEQAATAAALQLLPTSSHSAMAIGEFRYTHAQMQNETSTATLQLMRSLNQVLDDQNLEVTAADRVSIAANIDVFPSWQFERNGFLQQRQVTQLELATLNVKHEIERRGLRKTFDTDASMTDAECDHLWAEHDRARQSETGRMNATLQAKADRLFRTTQLGTEAFKAARDYALKNYMRPGTKGTCLQSVVDARSFFRMIQFTNDAFVSADQVTNQNLPYMGRAYVCHCHAHRFHFKTTEPALNYTTGGATGVGKTYVTNRLTYMTPPGIVVSLTNQTAAAMNVDQDFDDTCFVFEELDPSMLKSAKQAKEEGATAKGNYAKARMTAFMTATQYFHFDEELGRRLPKTCYSSQQIVMIGSTNQSVSDIDEAIARRLLLDFVTQDLVDTDGGKATDMDEFAIFSRSPAAKFAQNILRELHCAYLYVEKMILAGVWPDVIQDGARIAFNQALREAHTRRGMSTRKTTQQNWVIEAARVYTILDACFFALFSPAAHELYDGKLALGDEPIERWSPRMFQKLVAPRLAITKDALIEAATQFDFLFSSRDEQRLMHTIATAVCHLDQPDRWKFRVITTGGGGGGGNDRHAPVEYDYNYFSFAMSSHSAVYTRLSDLNQHNGGLRVEDIRGLLQPYFETIRDTSSLQPRRGDPGNPERITALVSDTGAPKQPRPAFLFEHDPHASTRSKFATQLCVSIDFIAHYFGLAPTASEDEFRRALRHSLTEHPAALFQSHMPSAEALECARALSVCPDQRSPLIEALRRVYSNRVLELSPYEPVPPPNVVWQLHTSYMPDMPVVRFPGDVTKRVPLHGAPLILTLARDPRGPLLVRENFNRPLPSAQVSIFSNVIMSNGAAGYDASLGIKVDDYDVDFHVLRSLQRMLGDSGLRTFERAFVDHCAAQSGLSADYTRSRMPPMNEQDPLPWAFPPLLYRIEKTAAKARGDDACFQDYPATNIYQRLSDTTRRTLSVLDGTHAAYNSFGNLTDTRRAPKRQRTDADQLALDASAPAPSRPRLVLQDLPAGPS